MKVESLGPGCPKCNKLAENAAQAVEELGVDAEIVKITDIQEMTKRGVMMTPALVIDGEVKSVGKVPSALEIVSYLADCAG